MVKASEMSRKRALLRRALLQHQPEIFQPPRTLRLVPFELIRLGRMLDPYQGHASRILLSRIHDRDDDKHVRPGILAGLIDIAGEFLAWA
jgi:hypothetical protein